MATAATGSGGSGASPILAEVYGPDPGAPTAFVERCRAVGRGQDAALEQFQRDEMAQLLAYAQSQSSDRLILPPIPSIMT